MNLSTHRLPPQVIHDELQAVQALLVEVAEALHFPLNRLVDSQIQGAKPFVRAAVVLATACNNDSDELLKTQRINLAAALEMLHVALNVHKSLLIPAESSVAQNGSVVRPASDPSNDSAELEKMDKMVMGSTILAGDYCFSRSAAMATQTGDPLIVDIFSEALRRVSEEHLRSIFDESSFSHTEDETLLLAGIQTSAQLIGAPAAMADALTELCTQLLDILHADSRQSGPLLDSLDSHKSTLSETQLTRWREMVTWLAT